MDQNDYISEPEKILAQSNDGPIQPPDQNLINNSKIIQFYKNKTVFITGVTGLLGKLLIEKLLRLCFSVKKIYILVRPNKDATEFERIEKLFSEVVFTKLHHLCPNFQEKIEIIKGDLLENNLGLSEYNKNLIINEVNIIFHVAATVRFDEELKIASEINVRSTKDLLIIAEQCKHLESFIYVGTAYSNCIHSEIDEIFYDTPIHHDELFEKIRSRNENLEKSILKDWPNTYTFTKAIAEDTVKDFKSIPVCIIRPSIVVSTWREPLRSWIDNFNGLTGMVLAVCCGALHTILVWPKHNADIIPADFVINAMVAASYTTAIDYRQNQNNIPIYNVTSSPESPITSWMIMLKLLYHCNETPLLNMIWYHTIHLTPQIWIHNFYIIFFHYIPAIVVDLIFLLIGKEAKYFNLLKMISKSSTVLSYFTLNQWKFYNRNVQQLWQHLGEEDQKLFYFSMKNFNWDHYFETYYLGLRRYVLEQPDTTIPYARKKLKRLYYLHLFTKFTFLFVGSVLFYEFIGKLIKLF